MPAQFKLDDRDRAKYGGPEWVTLDHQALDDTPSNISGPWDREIKATIGKGIKKMLVEEFANATCDGITATVWLALKMAEVEVPALRDFHIIWARVGVREEPAGDASPPEPGSSEPSSPTSP